MKAYTIVRDSVVAVLLIITLGISVYAVTRQGTPGPRGPQGAVGAQGEAGPSGPAGAAADQGPRGVCVTYTTNNGVTWVSGVSSPYVQSGAITCPNGSMVSTVPAS